MIDVVRPSGCRPRTDKPGDRFSIFEDTVQIIPRSQWKDLIAQNTSLRTVVKKIKNQGQEGSCASNATAQAYEIVWNMTFGPQYWVEFSPMSIYRWVGSGPNSGSTLDENLEQLRSVGLLPVQKYKTFQHYHPATGYYTKFMDGWKDTAVHFQAAEWFDVTSFEGMVTAMLLDFPIVYGRAGHAICGTAPVMKNGKLYIEYANSWGDWGDAGYGYDSEGFVAPSINAYGCWALRAIKLSPEVFTSVAA